MLLLEIFLDNNRLLADQSDRDVIQSIISLYIADKHVDLIQYIVEGCVCVCVCVCVCIVNNHNQEDNCDIMVPNAFFFFFFLPSFVIARLLLHITIQVLLITTALIVCWDLTGKVSNNFLQRQWRRHLQLKINLPSNDQSRYRLNSVYIYLPVP